MDYQISCPDDFNDILQKHIGENYTNGNTYTVTNDLDFSGVADFNPLGSGTKYTFNGTLYGQGHVIKNLTVNGSQSYNLGLFDTIGQNGSVENLRLQSVVIKQDLSGITNPATQTCAGTLAAVCYGSISGCCADGSISLEVSVDYSKAGGLCGRLPLTSAAIKDSWANVSINFSSAVSRTVSDKASYLVGGLAGECSGRISSCHSKSEISSPPGSIASFAAGGICGGAFGAEISFCYNTGYIHGRGIESDLLGGIAGNTDDSGRFSNCYYLKGCIRRASKELQDMTGSETDWSGLVNAASALGDDFKETPSDKDGYTYAPYIRSFSLDENYLKALCMPLVLSFTSTAIDDQGTPVRVIPVISDGSIFDNKVLLTAVKPDGSADTFEVTAAGDNTFERELGSDQYTGVSFSIPLRDKYGYSTTITNEDVTGEQLILLPYIISPSVKTGRENSVEVPAEPVSGFLEAAQEQAVLDYKYFKYHWFGNTYPPAPTKYYAEFSAVISGAVSAGVCDENGKTLITGEIDLNEKPKSTFIGKITKKDSPYSFKSLSFKARNGDLSSRADWSSDGKIETEKSVGSGADTDVRPLAGKQKYPLVKLTWRMTSRCNLSCRHCGLRDAETDTPDLGRDEIKKVIGDIIRFGVKEVILSGGEILLSPYWYETAALLSREGVSVGMITNGTLIDKNCAEKIRSADIFCVSVSIDDVNAQSAGVRGEGSFEKALSGVKHLKAAGVTVSVVTTVNAQNILNLDTMRKTFTESGADYWGLKPLYPKGEALRNKELLLSEADISRVLEYAYNAMFTEGIKVVPAATFEIHSKKGEAVERFLYGEDGNYEFYGDSAGIFSAQLNPDGGLVGICMCSSRDAVGNVKDRSLYDLWYDERSFDVLRNFDPDRLSGYCGICDRRATCRGGELNIRLAFGGINAENKFCTYRNFKLNGIEI